MWKVMPHVLGATHAFQSKVFAPYCCAHSKVNHLPGFHACTITNWYKKEWQLGRKGYARTMTGNIPILDVGPVIFWNTEELIDFLQQKHLLASNMVCSNCGTAMAPRQKSDVSNGCCIFCCCSCKTTKSLRAGSFISKSESSLQQRLVLLYWWVCKYPMSYVTE